MGLPTFSFSFPLAKSVKRMEVLRGVHNRVHGAFIAYWVFSFNFRPPSDELRNRPQAPITAVGKKH